MPLRIVPDVIHDQTVHSLRESGTARDAAQEMIRYDVSAVVIVDENDRLVGIVTERDMTRRVVAEARNSDTVTLGEIMTVNPETLAPGDPAHEALGRMLRRGFRHLPVLEEGRVVGVVSMQDLQKAIATYSAQLGL